LSLALEHTRAALIPIVGQHLVSIGEVKERNLAPTQRDRKPVALRVAKPVDSEAMGRADQVINSNKLESLYGGDVERLRECLANPNRSAKLAVEVIRTVGAAECRRRVHDHGRR
jgi:hypothetical protein